VKTRPYVESRDNLDPEARVTERARILGDAFAHRGSYVGGNAVMFGTAAVLKGGRVNGAAVVGDNAVVEGQATGDARVMEDAYIGPGCRAMGDTLLRGTASLFDNTDVYEQAIVQGEAELFRSKVYGKAIVQGQAELFRSKVYGKARVQGQAELYDCDISGTAVILGGIWEDQTLTEGTWLGPDQPLTTNPTEQGNLHQKENP